MKGCRLYWNDEHYAWRRWWDVGKRLGRNLYLPSMGGVMTDASRARLKRVLDAANVDVLIGSDYMEVEALVWRGNDEADALRAENEHLRAQFEAARTTAIVRGKELATANAELAAARAGRDLYEVTMYEVGKNAVSAIVDTREAADEWAAKVDGDDYLWVTVTEYTLNDTSALARFVNADEEGNE